MDGQQARPLRADLSKFFQQSAKLVATDPGTLQDVVSRLASVGGLSRIQELVDQDLSSLPDTMKIQRFLGQHAQFFKTLAHPDVLSSILLEQPIGDLFTFLYGFNGQRAVKLFSFTAQVLLALPQEDMQASAQPATEVFNDSFLVLAKVIDLNGGAQIHPDIAAIVETFSAALTQLVESQGGSACHKAQTCLTRMQQRLGIGHAIPELTIKLKTPVKPVSFGIAIDPPGSLSPNGPRHDNDHQDIRRIKVLPTWQEVQSLRSEYLPAKESEDWHKQGIQGLLDRHFRLLREDTVGQLRDVIQTELGRMKNSGSHPNTRRDNRQGLRSHVYQGVRIEDLSVNRRDGLRCEISFAQPLHVRTLNTQSRAQWWEASRRLQPDAFVCLLDDTDLLLFCSVNSDPPKPMKTVSGDDQSNSQKKPDVRNLYTDVKSAFVTLKLVEFNDETANSLLRRCYEPRQMVLVEFPGVLLPAFQPTLEALQQMAKSEDVPFPEFLAPEDQTAGVVHVPPPAYSRGPNFRFNLRTITDSSQNLHLSTQGNFDVNRLVANSSLDEAQARAVVDSLTRNFALIQGPPGTGKSYTGIALIKVLLDNRKEAKLGPILCVCYTNHALDQLLEHLVHAGISQIIRVGSRSKSEALEPLMLRNVARKMEGTKAEKRVAWELGSKLQSDESEIEDLITTLSKADSWSSVKQYLGTHCAHHHDQLFGSASMDEHGFRLNRDPKKALAHWLRGDSVVRTGQPDRPVSILDRTALSEMSQGERQKLYWYWVQRIRGTTQRHLIQALHEYDRNRVQYQRNRMEMDLRCLQQAHIIGITTSGLARNLDILRRVRAKVMLCEEAGEVLESHTLTAMLPSVEHAILIGDHFQLRPQINRYDLGREHPRGEEYSLDVSLFERLVQPNDANAIQLPFTTLETQRRMHPMISQLVRDTLYPSLQDALSTSTYPMVAGMKKRLFWYDHTEFEANSDEAQGVVSTSHTNSFEIDMTIGLVSHLMKQGVYHADEIAVLTPYLGQLHLLRARLGRMWELVLNDRDLDQLEQAGMESDDTPKVSKASALKALKVATIDNFQGEEAKVVIISLVRSNRMNKCGFLKTSNRINVLLSRAQHGMFIIGNSETAGSVKMWANVLGILRAGGNVGSAFELQCARHPDNPIEVKHVEDFAQFSPEGGCNRRCDQRLRCGHSCINKCHSAMLHDAVKCLEPCPRPIKGCDHSCPRSCGDSCPEKCTQTVHDASRTLPCGHSQPDLPCWQSQDLSTVYCKTKVLRTIPGCHHKVELPCHVDYKSDKYECPARCDVLLQCGHSCKQRCKTCKKRTDGTITQENHGICGQVCGRDYTTCRHSCTEKCHGDKPCRLCNAQCEIFCSHSRCSKKCHEPCSPCAEQCCMSRCPHSECTLPCAAPCDWLPCSKRCEKMLPCGHQCPSICGEACPGTKFCQLCAPDSIKEMQVDYIMMLTYQEVDLSEDPCLFPGCGHIMTVANMDGHMDMAKHYNMSPAGTISGLKPAPPFSNDELKTCPTCRGSLRNISRYGRIIRRALLDESTKKFIVSSHNEYLALHAQYQRDHDQLANTADIVQVGSMAPVKLNISGQVSNQINLIRHVVGSLLLNSRYKNILELRNRIQAHVKKVTKEEQPFKRVYDFCQDARRRRDGSSSFDFDQDVLQTKAHLMGTALLIRCELAILSDVVSVWRDKLPSHLRAECILSLSSNRERCLGLSQEAAQAKSPLQSVEALLFYAQYNAIERPFVSADMQEQLREEALDHVDTARKLCAANPGSTNGMVDEVDAVEKMLRASTFFSVVTSEERRAVLAAMATEFLGTGHWYYCENGHPFTVGECGMPMQQTRCPDCGAPAGGRDHASAAGVRRAEDLEMELRDLHL